MKIKERIVSSLRGLDKSFKRFPVTMVNSLILLIFLIYIRELDYQISNELLDKLNRIAMTIGLGIPLFLSIALIEERFYKKDRLKEALSYGLGLLALVLYYFFFLKEINNISMIRYTGSWIFLIISFFYLNRIKHNEGYEKYVINLFGSIFLTIIYSLVLLGGIYIILFTIDQLFDLDIKGKYYYYVYLTVNLIFALAFLLSKLPRTWEEFQEASYVKALEVLLSYIVIPLISIYTIILYLYFGKILIQWDWPKGLVSHLVIWYSALSVGVIFLISPIVDDNKICKSFARYFPKVNLPILLMMFISIGQRVHQYGITEKRYYVLVLGLWVTAMMIYLGFKGREKNMIIPITLSLVVLNSVYGPLSSMSVSRFSQNRRFKSILLENSMLDGERILKARDNLDSKAKQEINNILVYFHDYHSLKDIKLLDKDFELDDMEKVFGFEYDPNQAQSNNDYFFYYRGEDSGAISIKDYDYLIPFLAHGLNDRQELDGYEIKHSSLGQLTITRQGEEIIDLRVDDLALDLHKKISHKSEDVRGQNSIEDMTSYTSNEKIEIKLIFNDISGRISLKGQAILDGYSYMLFINIK